MTDTTAALETKKPEPAKTKAAAPAPIETPVVEAKPERFIPASESRFQTSSDFGSPVTSYVPEAGTPFEHLLRPEYWANIKALKARCRIWVEAEDGTYVAELYVLKVGQGYAKVVTLPGYPFALPGVSADPSVPDGYEIQFRGHMVKHRVVRLKDGHVLKQGLDTFEDAQAWLRDHKRMLAN